MLLTLLLVGGLASSGDPSELGLRDVLARACVESKGELGSLARIAGIEGWKRLSHEEAASLHGDLRLAPERAAYQAGPYRVLLAKLPGGVRPAVQPVQTPGEPLQMWNFNFPEIRVCRVLARSAAPGWAEQLEELASEGRRVGRPALIHTTHVERGERRVLRTWALPGLMSFKATAAPDDRSDIELTMSYEAPR